MKGQNWVLLVRGPIPGAAYEPMGRFRQFPAALAVEAEYIARGLGWHTVLVTFDLDATAWWFTPRRAAPQLDLHDGAAEQLITSIGRYLNNRFHRKGKRWVWVDNPRETPQEGPQSLN